ncbi:hypothetical protein N186_03695 [Thermofilum adornatum]|uniref:MrfA-like Zn-binding domain-containing protein n=1 Tax=Thermofilum adornatum TaxID=1365176 RepID=S5ZKM5_9CREN|nr:hypothetical protein N186_03695 [Thermofilum adornatum]
MRVLSQDINYSLLDELARELDRLKSEMYQLSTVFDLLARQVRGKKVKVIMPENVLAELENNLISLRYFWCSKCGKIYRDDEVPKNFKCDCGGKIIQAYIAAPKFLTPPNRYFQVSNFSTYYRRSEEYLFIPVAKFVNAYCDVDRKNKVLKRIVRISTERPVSSLIYACPDVNRSSKCPWKLQLPLGSTQINVCGKGRGNSSTSVPYAIVRPPRRENTIYRIVPPSESLTKPFSINLFKTLDNDKIEINFPKESMPGIIDIAFTKAKVYQLTLFLLAGTPYAGKRERIPIVSIGNDNAIEVIGRKIETEGLLINLDPSKVKETQESLQKMGFSSRDATPTVITHTLAHLFLITAPLIAGLSEHEFGEAIKVDQERDIYQVLIYDNSPGGIGGVRSLIEKDNTLKIDYIALVGKRTECPRSCNLACKACLFSANCMWLNYVLNRFSLNFIIDKKRLAHYVV